MLKQQAMCHTVTKDVTENKEMIVINEKKETRNPIWSASFY
jgi:hypothetical protein